MSHECRHDVQLPHALHPRSPASSLELLEPFAWPPPAHLLGLGEHEADRGDFRVCEKRIRNRAAEFLVFEHFGAGVEPNHFPLYPLGKLSRRTTKLSGANNVDLRRVGRRPDVLEKAAGHPRLALQRLTPLQTFARRSSGTSPAECCVPAAGNFRGEAGPGARAIAESRPDACLGKDSCGT